MALVSADEPSTLVVHSEAGIGIPERAVLDALPRAVVVTNPAGQITMWNGMAEQMYGWSEHEVVGRSLLEVLAPPDDLDKSRADLATVASGHSLSGDRVVVRRDGTSVRIVTVTKPILDPAGEIVGVVGVSEDVGDLRLVERLAQDLSEHLGLALRAGGLGTWRWEAVSGVLVWDERMEALFGLSPGGFDGTFETYVSLMHPDDRQTVLNVIEDAMATRSGYRVAHRVVWPNGSIRWIEGLGGVSVDEHGTATGTMGCAGDVTERAMQDLERERLTAMAEGAAEQERLHRERLEFLGAINDALNTASDVHDVMVQVAKASVPRLGDWCAIYVLPSKDATVPDVEIAHVNPEMVAYAHELQRRHPYDPDAPRGVPQVIRTSATEFYPDITEDIITELRVTDDVRKVIAHLALRSSIAVPLLKRGRVLGAMQFVMSSSSRHYTEDDVVLAHTVAGRVASSLENHRLNDETRIIAHTLQRSLLPASLPEVPGFEFAVRYWPAGEATEVGGDFYDLFALDAKDRWALVIGDVCGSGPTAAALTGLARHSIRESAWHGDSPVEVLTSLNRAVRRSETDSFLTAAFAVLDASGTKPELTIACGGHPLPVLATGQGATPIGAPGTLLGVIDDVRFDPVVTQLAAGDAVVFYTDGATDLRPPHALTEQQFADVIERAAAYGATAEMIADRIHEALESILPFDQRDDDLALLVLRVTDGMNVV